jgi:hypothetical protein
LKKKRIKLSSISLLTIFALITACEHQNNLAPQTNIINTDKRVSKAQIKGTVEFPMSKGLSIKANIGDVSNQSTVSIIYLPNHPTLANQTVATGLTDNSGNFIINPDASFNPAMNESFILEADKRIGGVGQDKLTIMTFIRWNGSGWESMTSPGILINTKTTALTIIASYNTATITASETINKILNGVPQAINATVTAQTINDVAGLVTLVLNNNYDPVHYIGFQNDNYLIVEPQPLPTPTPVPTATPIPIGEFRVNTYTSNHQRESSVAMDSDGDFVVTWQSYQSNTAYEIYAQRYNNAGIAQGAEFRVNSYTTATQKFPSVAMDNDGDFVITWISHSQDGNLYGIYAQRYNSAGTAQGSEFKVNSYTTGHQWLPSVAMDRSGNFVITWQSNLQDGSDYGVYAQMFNSSGIAQGTEFRVNTYTTNPQKEPSIAMDDVGNFVVVWNGVGLNDTTLEVYAKRYNSSGTAQGVEFKVNSYTTGVQNASAVAMDDDGNFVISWSGPETTFGNGVFAQRYNSSGVAQGPEFQVNTYTTNGQTTPAVAMDNTGKFVISWQGNGSGDSSGIFAQRYNNGGVAQGSEFMVNSYTTDGQVSSSVAMDSTGNFIISWQSGNLSTAGPDGSGYGVYAQRYNSSGNPL